MPVDAVLSACLLSRQTPFFQTTPQLPSISKQKKKMNHWPGNSCLPFEIPVFLETEEVAYLTLVVLIGNIVVKPSL